VPPGSGESLPDTSQSGEDAGQEDCASATEPIVERDSKPTSDESTAEVRSRVDKTNKPRVS
jgi:hypothetical protein